MAYRYDDPPRRLPAVEREERKTELAKLLGEGLKLEGEYEPADSLIDLAVEIGETEHIKRIPWERCTCKQAEMEGEKQVTQLTQDKDGFIRAAVATEGPLADTSSILKLHDALTRRGAALHIGRVLSWTTHQALVFELMSALKRDAPAGYSRVSMEMAREYDRELWRRVTDLAGGRVKPQLDGTLPLDSLVKQVMIEPRTAMLLMPRQSAGKASSSDDGGRVANLERQLADLRRQLASQGGSRKQQQQNQPAQNPTQPPPKRDQSKGGGKGNGKLGGPSKRPRTNRVQGLEGMPTKAADGTNICFGYNLNKCTACKPGQTCPKGKHICGGCGSASCRWPTCSSKDFQ